MLRIGEPIYRTVGGCVGGLKGGAVGQKCVKMRGIEKICGQERGVERSVVWRAAWCLLALGALQAGDRVQAGEQMSPGGRADRRAASSVDRSDLGGAASGDTAGMEDGTLGNTPGAVAHAAADSAAVTGELSVETVVEQVLARNRSLAEMRAAWLAASARYPQVTSLEDPMFGATVAPASIGSKEVDFGYRLEISQKLPWPGKLGLRGRAASAEAAAAYNDVEAMRLELVESAKEAYYEYYLVYRMLAVNDESVGLLEEIRNSAEGRLKAGQAPLQDVLQADVELGRQQERALTLERMRKVASARINTLMHLAPDQPLAAAPEQLETGGAPGDVGAMRTWAVARRPDLQALAARLAADRAALASACKEYYPDFDVMAAYDAFWQRPEQDLRPMLGVGVNLPIRKSRRRGAVEEAQARLAQRRAELERRVDQVNFEVQQAYEQVVESEQVVRLYGEKILPTARENVKSARSAYTAGQIPFLTLIEAQRSLVELSERYYQAVADALRRRAGLERVVGGLESASP